MFSDEKPPARIYFIMIFWEYVPLCSEISSELTDRFGKHPEEVENLLKLVRVRLKAAKLGFRKVNISTEGMMIEFPPESETEFYEAESFQKLMQFVSTRRNKRLAMRQTGKTLHLAWSFDVSNERNPFDRAQGLLDELLATVGVSVVIT